MTSTSVPEGEELRITTLRRRATLTTALALPDLGLARLAAAETDRCRGLVTADAPSQSPARPKSYLR